MIEVRNIQGKARCDSECTDCDKEGKLLVSVGEMNTQVVCLKCARRLLNALGFMIISHTGESVAQLVGLARRRGAKR